jgi:hypothetical protein
MFIALLTNRNAFAFDYFRIANDYSCLSADWELSFAIASNFTWIDAGALPDRAHGCLRAFKLAPANPAPPSSEVSEHRELIKFTYQPQHNA